MTGIPKQTAKACAKPAEYVQHLYERVNYDPRLVVLTSPWRRFWTWDPSPSTIPSITATSCARTFEEHRERMILPSWKHIMNYESTYMSNDEMVEATYDAAL